MVEPCSARCSEESRSGMAYPCSSKHSRRAGINLFVMNASSFFPLVVGDGTGGVNEWCRMLIARTSPAAPRMYLPLNAILDEPAPSVVIWYANPPSSNDEMRESVPIAA